MAYLAMCVSGACFGNFFETPFGAIPYYLITGLAIAPLQQKRSRLMFPVALKITSHQQAHVYGLELFHAPLDAPRLSLSRPSRDFGNERLR